MMRNIRASLSLHQQNDMRMENMNFLFHNTIQLPISVASPISRNRNGKLFIEITKDNYEACGITTEIIDGDVTDDTGSYMSYSGHVWSNIEHAIISRPKPLFNFQCVHLFSGFTFQPPSIGEIDDDEKIVPKIVRHVTQNIQIELFLSAPGLNDRKRLSQYPNHMAMVGEMIWATIDLSEINFYRLQHANNAHLVLDECKLISTGKNAQEIQLINDGCPMFDFVTIQSHKGPQIHFSTRVLRFRQDFSNDQINLGCSLTVKKTGEPPLC